MFKIRRYTKIHKHEHSKLYSEIINYMLTRYLQLSNFLENYIFEAIEFMIHSNKYAGTGVAENRKK